MSHNNTVNIINYIRENTKSSDEISDHFDVSQGHMRNTLDSLHRKGVVEKVRRTRTVVYRVTSSYKRKRPLFEAYLQDGTRNFTDLRTLFQSLNVNTKSQEATKFLPELATRLLALGHKAQLLNENISSDTDAYSKQRRALERELKTLRLESKVHEVSMYNALKIFQQINKDPDFWSLDELLTHFNNQLDSNDNLIPPDDAQSIMEAYNDYKSAVTD